MRSLYDAGDDLVVGQTFRLKTLFVLLGLRRCLPHLSLTRPMRGECWAGAVHVNRARLYLASIITDAFALHVCSEQRVTHRRCWIALNSFCIYSTAQ